MKIAIALRTCGKIFNWWEKPKRIVDVSKHTLLLTCLNSLTQTIVNSKHEIIFSVHDDNSGDEFLSLMDKLISSKNVRYELIHTESKGNCITQYQWLKKQDCDYVYLIEDDYLHRDNAIDIMVDTCEYMKEFEPNPEGHYAIFPMNHPHRYNKNFIYHSYIFLINNAYWRSIFHSPSTFFISKKDFEKYDFVMKSHAYGWSNRVAEDDGINLFWNTGKVRLLCPMNSLAWHIASKSHEDKVNDWKSVWNKNLIEC